MATLTLGTAGTSTLTAVVWSPASAVLLPADMATINADIVNDVTGQPVVQPSFSYEGFLYVPNRGKLVILPGDVIAIDPATGFPILLSAGAAAGASWVLS